MPKRFYDLYDDAEIRAALQASLADGTIIPGNGEYFDVPPMIRGSAAHAQIAASIDTWVDYIHAYMASVSYADAKVGEVLDALAADPQRAADTAIVLWSDNGFALGDHDRWQKLTNWRESTEVPLIVVDPDRPGRQVADQVVSLVDIFPTVLDLMDVRTPGRLDLAGESLLPIVRNVDIDWYDPDTGRGVALTVVMGAVSIRAIVPGAGDVRYTLYPDGTEELYRLGADPDEHVNRLNYRTGEGLTAADDALRTTVRALGADRLDDAGHPALQWQDRPRRNGSRRDADRRQSRGHRPAPRRRRQRHLPPLQGRYRRRERRRRVRLDRPAEHDAREDVSAACKRRDDPGDEHLHRQRRRQLDLCGGQRRHAEGDGRQRHDPRRRRPASPSTGATATTA